MNTGHDDLGTPLGEIETEGTSRKKATGRDRLPDSHPAAAYRGAFTAL